MNGQPLFRFQLSEKNRIQDVDTRRPSLEHSRSKVLDSQVHSSDSKQMSIQRSLSMQQQSQQQHENEHLGTLHARLHQEADKIRKWKIQTELDLKDKIKKLTEASLQIDIMKKSLLELQVENERTSARLQEEIGSRENVLQRINGTREMCNLLQVHASKVDDRITNCETERTELKYVGKENMQLIEELTKQLHNLQLATSENNKKIQSQANVERSDRLQAEKAMTSKCDAMEQELQRFNITLQEKNTELSDLLVSLKEKEETIQAVEITKDELQKKVSSLHEELLNKEEELKECSLRISTVQNDKCRLEKMMKELEHEFNSLQIAKDSITLDMGEAAKRFEERLQNAKQDADSTKIILEDEQHKLKACKEKLVETSALVENLKMTRDSLMMEKTETEIQIDLQKFQMNNLLTEKTEDKEEIHRLNGEIVILAKKLDNERLCRMQAQDENETLQTRVSNHLLERDDHIGESIVLKNELSAKQEKIKSLESLLSEEEHKSIHLQSNIDQLELRISCDRKLLEQAEGQIDKIKQELDKKDADIQMKDEVTGKLENELQKVKSDNEEQINELKVSKAELESLKLKISKQYDKIKDLTSQFKALDGQRMENDKSLTSQQKKVAAISKQNNDLEKKMKSMKTTLEKEKELVKERDVELIHLRKELENMRMMKENSEKSLQQYENEMSKVKEMCEHEQEASKLALKRAKEMQESAHKEKQNALALTDCQLAEMMATLDTYKQNNEKLIAEKDADIQALRSKLENAESLTAVREKELSESKKEIEHLKMQAATMTTEESHKSSVIDIIASEKQSPRTPAPVTPMKTPQSSILRTSNLVSVSKRRKVAFVPSDGSQQSTSEDSDLMEFNTELGASIKVGTPLLYKVSPKCRSAENLCMAASRVTPKRIPMNIILTAAHDNQTAPDASAVKKTSTKQYTNEAPPICVEPRSKIMNDGKIPNVRKTPAKKMSKIFTSSPRNKALSSKTKIKEKTKPCQMSWFELDSVYGFGPED